MLTTQPANEDNFTGKARIGLALAGGGPLGIIYEIGVLLALDEALEGINFNDLHAYVGVSAGSVNAAILANGFPPAKLCRLLVLNQSEAFPIDFGDFFRPAWRLYGQGLKAVPRYFMEALQGFIKNPRDSTLLGVLSTVAHALPSGIFDNDSVHRLLAKMFSSRGCTNDFRQLQRHLFVVVTNLDTGEIVRFGAEGSDQALISRAVQASTAVPGLYPPVKIDGHYYIDGGIIKTVHASTALDAGADLLICINPIVSFNPKLAKPAEVKNFTSLFDGGYPTVTSQAFRTLIHSRMKIGIAQYATSYPDKEVILFEPDSGDARIFFANVFSFANRRMVCEHAYQTTRADLLARQDTLAPLLAQYGIILQMDVLQDQSLHFDTNLRTPPEISKRSKWRNKVINELSDTLDRLEAWTHSSRRHSPEPHDESANPVCLMDPNIRTRI